MEITAALQKLIALIMALMSFISVTIKNNESAFYKKYVYEVVDEEYSDYIPGKVIEEEKVGEKLGDVTVSAKWVYYDGHSSEPETLRGAVYAIKGVNKNTAVCIRFTDKGEALTTTHYYVMIDPQADPSAVADYIIPQEPSPAEGDIVAE